MPENPFIPPLNLPGPGQRLRYAGQESGSPMIDGGPVATRPPHVIAETNRAAQRVAEYTHPWKITVDEDLGLSVGFGAVTTQALFEGNLQSSYPEVSVTFDGTNYLTGDPYHLEGPYGSTTLSNSASYGVWLKLERQPALGIDGGFDSDYEGLITSVIASAATIFVSTEYLGPGYWTNTATAPPYADDFAYVFLGRVVVSSGGVATITQHRRSDLVMPMLAYPYGINFPEEEPPP
jgi:hypothetical protein